MRKGRRQHNLWGKGCKPERVLLSESLLGISNGNDCGIIQTRNLANFVLVLRDERMREY